MTSGNSFKVAPCLNSVKVVVLIILCLQNSLFTVVRRYSQGVLEETYSKVSCKSMQDQPGRTACSTSKFKQIAFSCSMRFRLPSSMSSISRSNLYLCVYVHNLMSLVQHAQYSDNSFNLCYEYAA